MPLCGAALVLVMESADVGFRDNPSSLTPWVMFSYCLHGHPCRSQLNWVHSDVEPDGRLIIMRALQGDAVLRGSHDHESRSKDHREMADIGIERREAIPQFISNFEVCENYSRRVGEILRTLLCWAAPNSDMLSVL